ncbi:MAG TPA: S9 family peptidase [Gemmatimonadaceae bacterium]|nr:S9 family peptidase [Gemmatimonadaceae bacterium]
MPVFRAIRLATLLAPMALAAQAEQADPARLTIERIFARGEFRSAALPDAHWLTDGTGYIDLRPAEGGGTDVVRVDLRSGRVSVLAEAAALIDDAGRRLEVEEITLSGDQTKALLFHSSVRVWRQNTRGVYHVLDLATRRVTPVSRTPGLQMFAKFSPDGRRVAFVRANDLWVADWAAGTERRLTTDGSADIINGTTDWVYEEELGLRDAYRWSPDGRRIAYWRFDQSQVPAFPMVNELALYPDVATLRYPKAGEPNAAVRVGVMDLADGRTRWIDVGGDTGLYIPRMEWLGSDSLVIQRMPRRQNRVDVLVAAAATGAVARTLLADRDSAYVDVEDHPWWVRGGRQFLWSSDRSGWRQIYLYDRSGRVLRQVTADGADVLGVAGVDERRGHVYVTVAAPDPTQRQVWRYPLDGKTNASPRDGERVTRDPGTHQLDVGPNARFAIGVYSTAATPPVARAYSLPGMRVERTLGADTAVAARVRALAARPPQFFKVPMPDGTVLDAYRIVPAGFDSTRRYPVLMYVYGGPASPTVNDAWGGNRYLWHQMLAQNGYVVVSVDNRGAAWRGRAFRKVTQLDLGASESRDQIDAARWLAERAWVDPQRIGLWGWSYGGYMSSLTAARAGDLFRAAIAVAPVTDWRLYDSIYTERYMWTPQENAGGYERSAPLSYAGGLTARFLLVHGTGDDNVHPQNSTQLAERLIEAGKPFYQLLYPNRTHSITGGNAQAHLYASLTSFLDDYLKPTPERVVP